MRSLIVAFDTEGSLDTIHDLAFVAVGWYDTEIHLLENAIVTGDVRDEKGIMAFRRHLTYLLDKYKCGCIHGLCWSKHDKRIFESTRKKLMDVPFIYHDLLEIFRDERKKHFNIPTVASASIGKLGVIYISPHYNQKHNALDDTLDMIRIMEMQDAQIMLEDYYVSMSEMEITVDRIRCWTRLMVRIDITSVVRQEDASHDVVEYEGERYTIRKGWTAERHYGFGLYKDGKLVRARKQEILDRGKIINEELDFEKLSIS